MPWIFKEFLPRRSSHHDCPITFEIGLRSPPTPPLVLLPSVASTVIWSWHKSKWNSGSSILLLFICSTGKKKRDVHFTDRFFFSFHSICWTNHLHSCAKHGRTDGSEFILTTDLQTDTYFEEKTVNGKISFFFFFFTFPYLYDPPVLSHSWIFCKMWRIPLRLYWPRPWATSQTLQ